MRWPLGLLFSSLDNAGALSLSSQDMASSPFTSFVEARDIKKRAEQERQLLADKLRSKWEQERVRELQRLKEHRYEDLKVRLAEMTNENARRAEENSQLRGQKDRIEEVQSENAALKAKLVQVTEQRNAAIGEVKRLQTQLKDVGCELNAMRQLAEKRQQEEKDLEETKRLLHNKAEEVEHFQRAWAEQRRTHEEDMQVAQAQLREFEKQYQQQSQQCELLSQQLEQEKRKKSNLITSELLQVTSPATAQASAEQSHDLCNHEDCYDTSEKAAEVLASHTSTSTSDAAHNSPGCSLLSDEGPVDETRDSGVEHVSFELPSLGQGLLKLRRFLARFSYNPFEGPNEHPEAELPLTAGEYVYVLGDMDEDGWFVGELTDGKRGFIPSNFVEEVSDDEPVTNVPPELRDLLQDSDDEERFCSRSRRKKRNKNKES